MYKIPLADIKQKILESKKLSPRELDARIKTKINELSGLISEEGAAHIIANELGVELISSSESTKLKIREVYAGMRNVSTVGKVVKKFEVRTFSKEGKEGRVCAVILGDDTGTVRLVFWNEQVDLLTKVQEDDILLVKKAYARENNNACEIHLGRDGEITINPEGEKVDVVRKTTAFERKTIGALQPNEENVELLGTIVQVFDPRFFSVCPTCAKKVLEAEGGFNCQEHGIVQPAVSYVMNVVLDDGTGNIRGVFWKNQTAHLLGKTEEEIARYKDNLSTFENVKTDLLGEQFKVKGRVKNNEMFNRLEFNVQLVEKANAAEEIARLEKS